jgi:hypothetical protein
VAFYIFIIWCMRWDLGAIVDCASLWDMFAPLVSQIWLKEFQSTSAHARARAHVHPYFA